MTTTVEAMQKLLDIWDAETDPLRERQLRRLYEKLSDLLISIADIDVRAHAKQLEEATTEITTAIVQLEKAVQENKKIAERINQVAQAIALLVEVVKLLKP